MPKEDLEPVKPTEQQIKNSISWGWTYDEESYLFERGEDIGFFTKSRGFQIL